MQPIRNIVQLRQFLADRLPNFSRFTAQLRPPRLESRRAGHLDHLFLGALAKGSVTEVVGPSPSSGGALLTRWLLHRAREMGQWLALVDGRDSFDPTSLDAEVLSRLLWVRCADAGQAMKAADLLLRDENLTTIVLDLQINPVAQLRRIPASAWYRFQRLIEHHASTLLVFTPQPLVSGVRGRVVLRNRFGLDSLNKSEEELLGQFQIEVTRREGKEIGQGAMMAAETG